MTQSDLSTIRRVLLEVIDDGNLRDKKDRHWHFNTADQATVVHASIDTAGDELQLSESQRRVLADKARLDFCNRVAELLVKEIKDGETDN